MCFTSFMSSGHCADMFICISTVIWNFISLLQVLGSINVAIVYIRRNQHDEKEFGLSSIRRTVNFPLI